MCITVPTLGDHLLLLHWMHFLVLFSPGFQAFCKRWSFIRFNVVTQVTNSLFFHYYFCPFSLFSICITVKFSFDFKFVLKFHIDLYYILSVFSSCPRPSPFTFLPVLIDRLLCSQQMWTYTLSIALSICIKSRADNERKIYNICVSDIKWIYLIWFSLQSYLFSYKWLHSYLWMKNFHCA